MTFTEKIKQLYDDMDSSYGMPKWMNTLLDEMKFHNKALLKVIRVSIPFILHKHLFWRHWKII